METTPAYTVLMVLIFCLVFYLLNFNYASYFPN